MPANAFRNLNFRGKAEVLLIIASGILFAATLAVLIVTLRKSQYESDKLQTLEKQNTVLRDINKSLLTNVGNLATVIQAQSKKDSARLDALFTNQRRMLENQKVAPLVPVILKNVREIKRQLQ